MTSFDDIIRAYGDDTVVLTAFANASRRFSVALTTPRHFFRLLFHEKVELAVMNDCTYSLFCQKFTSCNFNYCDFPDCNLASFFSIHAILTPILDDCEILLIRQDGSHAAVTIDPMEI